MHSCMYHNKIMYQNERDNFVATPDQNVSFEHHNHPGIDLTQAPRFSAGRHKTK